MATCLHILEKLVFDNGSFLGFGMRIDLFQSCGHSWVFQVCWHIEWNIFMVSSFRVLNSCTGIPSHSLALLTAVLPKAHLTLLSRMSDSGWLFTQSCEQNVLLHLLILPFSWVRNGISVKFSFAFLFSMGELIYFSICLRNTYTQSKSSVHISCPLWGFFSISFKELFIY